MKLIIAALLFASYCLIPQKVAGDSIAASWTPLLTGMKPYADEIGEHEIDAIISILPVLDQAIADNDKEKALYIIKRSVAYTKKMLPHIKDAKIRKEYSEKMAGMQPLMDKIVKGDDMKNLDNYIVDSGNQGVTPEV